VLHIYQYFLQPVCGFRSARLQTWFPLSSLRCQEATVERKKPAKTGSARPTRRQPVEGPAKRPRKRPAEAVVPDAPPDKCFWVNDGPVLKNLRELRDALAQNISDEQFAHHVGGDRNDFARWVEEVLGDATCAKALRRARTRDAALKAVAARLEPTP
jgi:hypothetical protein